MEQLSGRGRKEKRDWFLFALQLANENIYAFSFLFFIGFWFGWLKRLMIMSKLPLTTQWCYRDNIRWQEDQ